MNFPISPLKTNPRSMVVDHGYIHVYTNLHPKELRSLQYTRRYKYERPAWDNTSIRLCHFFSQAITHRTTASEPLVVLDAGCGHGNYVIDEFRRNIDWACGVDINHKVTEKNLCLDEIRFSSLESIPYPDNTFDTVFCLWVLEHLDHPNHVIHEITRVLKPGGSFIFCTPNQKSAIVLLRRLLGSRLAIAINRSFFGRREADIFPTRYQANDRKTIARVLQNANLTIVRLELNFDPGYTSLNETTYRLTTALEKTVGRLFPTLTRPHIIGHAIKPGESLST